MAEAKRRSDGTSPGMAFERPIQELEDKLAELEAISLRTNMDLASEVEALREDPLDGAVDDRLLEVGARRVLVTGDLSVGEQRTVLGMPPPRVRPEAVVVEEDGAADGVVRGSGLAVRRQADDIRRLPARPAPRARRRRSAKHGVAAPHGARRIANRMQGMECYAPPKGTPVTCELCVACCWPRRLQ